jgi:hypothetical protein
MCIGFVPGTFIIEFILHGVLRFGSPTSEQVNRYVAIAAVVGAMTAAILGGTIGERAVSGGGRPIPSGKDRKFFQPLGLLAGLAGGAIFGATCAYLFVYGSHPTDAHDARILACIAAVLLRHRRRVRWIERLDDDWWRTRRMDRLWDWLRPGVPAYSQVKPVSRLPEV